MFGVITSLLKLSSRSSFKKFFHSSPLSSVVVGTKCSPQLLTYTNFRRYLPSMLENIDPDKIEFLKTDNEEIIVFTDGSCIHNHSRENERRSGLGVYWGYDEHPLNVSIPHGGNKLTNNRAEIAAAHVAILIAKHLKLERLCLFTDSVYVTKSCRHWLPLWKENSWKLTSSQKAVANRDLWMKIMEDLEFVLVDFQNCGRLNEGVKKAHKLAKVGAEAFLE